MAAKERSTRWKAESYLKFPKMTTHFLIDGYNLMHAAGLMKPRFGPGGLKKARGSLLGLLAGSLDGQAARTTVVFDACRTALIDRNELPSLTAHGIQVRFATSEDLESADSLIEELIRRDPTTKHLTVVSSDTRIRKAARRHGSLSIDSEGFLRDLAACRQKRRRKVQLSPEKPKDISVQESDSWVQEFEGRIDAADLTELLGPFAEEE